MLLTPEQESFREVVADFAARVIAPAADEFNANARFPLEIVAQMAELGLFGIPFPSEYGGMDGDLLATCIAIEEIGRVDQSLGLTLEAAVGLGATPIFEFGTEEQKQQWLPPLARGEALAAFGLTEPDGGTDNRGATRTRAVLDGDEWVINGSKAFITNVGTEITSICTVTAWTGEDEMSAIVVPVDTPGFIVEPAYRKVGWHASDTHPITLDDVRVPAANLLGGRGAGLGQFLQTLTDGRIAISALATGLIQGCIDECLEYTEDRITFGRPLRTRHLITFRIADMEVAAQTGRQMWMHAIERKQAGLPYRREASIAKLYASEQAVAAAASAAQIFGGMGFMTETRVGRFYQDAKVLEIGEGTSEVQRFIIGRELGRRQ
ncbi:MAG: acyl-CoA dehydrogenase family protein [Nitriliruptorales bacterium]|nr:acyl-CoA dehydrogenase family protein [Nitriliruptorales bacterium]